MASELQQAVREKVEAAEIQWDPFPHAVIPDLLPQEFFRRLSETIPPLDAFQSADDVKSNLRIMDHNDYFAAAPEQFRKTWTRLRDDVIRDTIAPILVRRLEADIREKFASLFSPELADEIMAGGLVSSEGRIMARKPGYKLNPHSDSAQYAVTCLLYFTSADDPDKGALCLFRPERRPELRHTSTYYPAKEEGIVVALAKEIPIRENLFLTFLNGPESLHGARVDRGSNPSRERLAYQVHRSSPRPAFGDGPAPRPTRGPPRPPALAAVLGHAHREVAAVGGGGGEGEGRGSAADKLIARARRRVTREAPSRYARAATGEGGS